MQELRYTLVTDGSSDAALLPILTWLLIEHGIDIAIQSQWADLGRLRIPTKGLYHKIELALELYPCDLLFIHRDAENQSHEQRRQEIAQATSRLSADLRKSHICVIPVRMSEAWLLFDEAAIRHAAGNRSGRQPLELPQLARVEALPDAKQVLHNLLSNACGLTGRRLRQFEVRRHARRVSEFITDFSPLRKLPAFARLEQDVIHFTAKFLATEDPNP